VTCGKMLVFEKKGLVIPVLPIDGLEASERQVSGSIPILPLDELDSARFENVRIDVPRAPEFESSQAASMGEVVVEKMADMQVDRVPDDGLRTAVPATPPCRYCGNPQIEGLLCERCGMRLSRPRVIQATVTASPLNEKIRCRACGSKAWPTMNCGNCGVIN
jgi:hypothetical protein